MLPYFILVGAPAAVALYNSWKRDEKRNKTVINVFFFIWLVLLLLRKETVGIDLFNYSKMFQSAIHTSYGRIFSFVFTLEHEFGFYFLAKLLSSFTTDFRVMLAVVALLSIIPVWHLYKNNVSKHPFLTIAILLNIGVFSIYFSGLRQVLAMGFVLPAYKYTQKGKPVEFLLMVLLAFLFHKSAIIMLLLYPAYYMKLNDKAYLFLIVSTVGVCYLFKKPIFTFLRSFISDYYSSNLQETGAIAILLLLLVFVVFSYVITDESEMSRETLGLRNILVVCALLQIFAGVNPLAMRLNYYYLLFVPIIIPKIAECAAEKNRVLTEFMLMIMICFFTAYYFYDAYTDVSTLKLYPYMAFWN